MSIKKNKKNSKAVASKDKKKGAVKSIPAPPAKPLTKSDKVREFLRGKTFSGCSKAHFDFQTAYQENMTYPQFNTIWREMLQKGECTVVEEKKEFVMPVLPGVMAEISAQEKEEIILLTPDQINGMFDESILVPFKSGTPLDNIISGYGGALPACVQMVPGPSGSGKTTTLLAYLQCIKVQNPNVDLLLVSSEQNPIHQYKLQRRIKMAGFDIKILFLGEYDFPHDVLERTLQMGFDIVLIDSFQDTVDKIMEASGMSSKIAERWLIKLMDRTRMKNNDKKKYTSFFCTQHMTKGGDYTGSSRVKHMTDAMMMFGKDDDENRYIEYSKNRDGSIDARLYYTIDDKGVTFDIARFERELKIKDKIQQELELKEKNADLFDELVQGTRSSTHMLVGTPAPADEEEEEEA